MFSELMMMMMDLLFSSINKVKEVFVLSSWH